MFRGYLFTTVNNFFGQPAAYIVSSAIFGLAHSPVFGTNAFVEALFGGFFAFTYVYSGYNLAVPIAVHTLYDFFTIFLTWYFASQDIQNKIRQLKQGSLLKLSSADTIQFETLTKAIFQTIDINGDGVIDAKEFDYGLRLFGLINILHTM